MKISNDWVICMFGVLRMRVDNVDFVKDVYVFFGNRLLV